MQGKKHSHYWGRILINGRFLGRPLTGVDRFALEVVREFDGLCRGQDVELLVPCAVDTMKLGFKNIQIRTIGLFHGNLWEQISLPIYAFRHGGVLVNLCNSAPLVKPDVVCLHDMQVRANPSFYTKAFVAWYRVMYVVIALFAKRVLTVSEFSKAEIKKYYPWMRADVDVIYNAWQHFDRIEEDRSVLQRHRLKEGEYYYSLSSLSPNKNFKWIVAKAQQNPSRTFVISGADNIRVFADSKVGNCGNIVRTGRVSDAEAKALMRCSKAFLFPSIYEGFGLPPLEALSTGCPVCVSNTSSLPEIFGDAVGYLNPHEFDGRLPEFVADEGRRQKVLARYQWKQSAEVLAKAIGLI